MNTQKRIKVREVMKTVFNWVDGKDTVLKALQDMEHHDTHVLIVRKRNDDDEYGIVRLADIARKVIAKDRSPNRVNIYEIMSKPVVCVRADMDIRYCARLFDRFGLNLAPVQEGNEIIGTVSYNDIVLKGLAKLLDD